MIEGLYQFCEDSIMRGSCNGNMKLRCRVSHTFLPLESLLDGISSIFHQPEIRLRCTLCRKCGDTRFKNFSSFDDLQNRFLFQENPQHLCINDILGWHSSYKTADARANLNQILRSNYLQRFANPGSTDSQLFHQFIL